MPRVDEQEFRDLLTLGHEQRDVEFKGPGRADDRRFFATVVRAVLGMANLRDGGRVIIGVSEQANLEVKGLDEAELATWKFDYVSARLFEHADPMVVFRVEQATSEDRRCVVVNVEEFADIPALCKRDFPRTLRRGACYVRGVRQIETVEVSSEQEMRELLDRAITKGVDKFVARARASGLLVPAIEMTRVTDSEQFDRPLDDVRQ